MAIHSKQNLAEDELFQICFVGLFSQQRMVNNNAGIRKILYQIQLGPSTKQVSCSYNNVDKTDFMRQRLPFSLKKKHLNTKQGICILLNFEFLKVFQYFLSCRNMEVKRKENSFKILPV